MPQELPPIIADFSIGPLDLLIRDARRSDNDTREAAKRIATDQVRTLASAYPVDARPLLCDDDPSVQNAFHDAAVQLIEEGNRMSGADMKAAGIGLKNDVGPDARYPDLAFHAFNNSGELVGGFAILKLRTSPIENGIIRASGTPWPQMMNWIGQTPATLWPAMTNHFLDNDLPFHRELGSFDLVEWKFPVDDPLYTFFPELEDFTNSEDLYGSIGMHSAMTLGRDEVRTDDDTMTKFIRRRDEIFEGGE